MMNQIIRYKPIIDFIRKNNPKNILEVGSGSRWIWKFMRNLKYTWLDRTTADYWIQEKDTSKNMKFVNGDSLAMPFSDNSFDLVFSLDMLEHIPEDKRIDSIREIVRVTNKYAIVGFPYGKLWSIADRLFYEFEMIKEWKVEWWLIEHIENGLPDDLFLNNLKKEFKEYEINEINNWNVFFVIFMVLLEKVRIVNKFLNIFSYIFAYLPITFSSKFGVRKFLIFKKPTSI